MSRWGRRWNKKRWSQEINRKWGHKEMKEEGREEDVEEMGGGGHERGRGTDLRGGDGEGKEGKIKEEVGR